MLAGPPEGAPVVADGGALVGGVEARLQLWEVAELGADRELQVEDRLLDSEPVAIVPGVEGLDGLAHQRRVALVGEDAAVLVDQHPCFDVDVLAVGLPDEPQCLTARCARAEVDAVGETEVEEGVGGPQGPPGACREGVEWAPALQAVRRKPTVPEPDPGRVVARSWRRGGRFFGVGRWRRRRRCKKNGDERGDQGENLHGTSIRDNEGLVRALRGTSEASSSSAERLWVSEKARGAGYGRRLASTPRRRARDRDPRSDGPARVRDIAARCAGSVCYRRHRSGRRVEHQRILVRTVASDRRPSSWARVCCTIR